MDCPELSGPTTLFTVTGSYAVAGFWGGGTKFLPGHASMKHLHFSVNMKADFTRGNACLALYSKHFTKLSVLGKEGPPNGPLVHPRAPP